jgi:hypothetical protein
MARRSRTKPVADHIEASTAAESTLSTPEAPAVAEAAPAQPVAVETNNSGPAEADIFDRVIAAREAEKTATPDTNARVEEALASAPVMRASEMAGPDGHAAGVRRRQEHSKLTIPAGDVLVHLLDKGDNLAGIGIRVEFPEGSQRPTEEEKEIIRRHIQGEDGRGGFTWKSPIKLWHKSIVRQGENPDDVPPSRPVAIRLDAESRVQKLADALRQHQADPQAYADRVRADRQHNHGHGTPG